MVKKYKVKSVTVSRKPGKDRDGYWTAFIGMFDENNPHLKGHVPIGVLEFKDIEKVRLHELRNVSYYLMGNDIVINDLIELEIEVKDHIVTLSGKQELRE